MDQQDQLNGPVNSPAPQPPLFAAPAWNGKTNRSSIIALVLSLIGWAALLTPTSRIGSYASLFSIVFGLGGLVQSRRHGDRRGKIVAIVALSVTAVFLLLLAAGYAIALGREAAGGTIRN